MNKNALTERVPAWLLVFLLLGMLQAVAPAAADEEAVVKQLVSDVARQLEVAVAADQASQVDLSRVRLTYLLATEGELAWNAGVTGSVFEAENGLALCQPRHSLVTPADRALPEGEWVDITMVLGRSLVTRMCESQPARLAAVMGHEFGHLTLGHLGTSITAGTDMLKAASLTREREFAADQAGVRYAEAAGYVNALSAATDCWVRLSEVRGNTTPLEPTTAFHDHPTNLERAAELQRDPKRREQWRAALTFENGVMCLQLGEWEPAQICFTSVLKQFKDSPETLTNLGYAKMMSFYAGLPVVERRKIGGEVSCLAFATVRPVIRGGTQTQKTPLQQAIGHYRAALKIAPEFLPAKSSLGAALLINPDASVAELNEAAALLDAVAVQADKRPGDEATLADARANLALAKQRLGGPEAGRLEYQDAYPLLEARNAVPLAFKANYASSLVASAVRADWEMAESLLRDYLTRTSPESYYYQVAARDWGLVCGKLGRPAGKVPAPEALTWLPGTHLTVPAGGSLFPQEPWAEAKEALAPYKALIVPAENDGTNFTCVCSDLGLTLRVSRGAVRVILLSAETSPAITLKSDREGLGPKLSLKVGQPLSNPAELGLMTDPLTIGSDKYKLYRQVGIALKFDDQDRIAGIALISG